MSTPLYWPGKYFFYPIGNTPAVSFTRDLSPRTPANILLLGCGDPRSVLFTVYNEHDGSDRRLDITCSDIDPAIIARNILLLTMIVDNRNPSSTIWKIFFDMKIDRDTHSILRAHCEKLYQHSVSQEAWAGSPYAAIIKFSTFYTLQEAHRHWGLYVEMERVPADRQKSIRDAFKKQTEDTLSPGARPAGPLMPSADSVYDECMKRYSAFGVCGSTVSASMINPTFAYSFVGEGCNVHYTTLPLTPFHSAALFGNATKPPRMNEVIQSAQHQFEQWCNAYRERASHPSRIILRFLIGEATAVCHAFQVLNTKQMLQTTVPVSQWRATTLAFDSMQYAASGNAPTVFNVIDSSNLTDHVGLLNVLVAALPLRTVEGIIYTESLLYQGEDATKEFTKRLFADLGTMALLLGVVPIDYLSGFFSRSNTHEIVMHGQFNFQQVTTWKSPSSVELPVDWASSVVFDSAQLGTFLWDMYCRMFQDEDSKNFWANHGKNDRAIAMSELLNYSRESFVLFLNLIRSNLTISPQNWESVMNRFYVLQAGDTAMPMDTVNRQDFHALLYRYNLSPFSRAVLPRVGRFEYWPFVPQVVRVALSVPHSVLENIFTGPDIGTPGLRCIVQGITTLNVFSSVHAAFGHVSTAGSRTSPHILFEEDKEGWKGKSPLVLSFTMPTQLLVTLEPQRNLRVGLHIHSSPGLSNMTWVKKLGPFLTVFSAEFLDDSHVHVVPEPQASSPFKKSPLENPTTVMRPTSMLQQVGACGPTAVTLDEECEMATWLSVRISIQNPDVIVQFGSHGATPDVKQLSPSVVRVAFSTVSQDISFPYPVRGSDHRLRLARKSLYIELLVPPAGPFQSGGLRVKPFPLTLSSTHHSEVQAWNIHYINLSRLPTVNCSRPKGSLKWLDEHIGSMMSTRERKIRKKKEKDDIMFVKDTLLSIMVRASGVQGGKAKHLFSLVDHATNNSDTLIFVSDLRYDQSAYTIVCDAFVLPYTGDFVDKHERPFSKLITKGDPEYVHLMEGEVCSWKHLIPAFVERCRTSWVHGENCEYKAAGKIPLTEEIEEIAICSCGQGKDVEGMLKNPLWRPFAPFVTRIALSPLFAVTYLEPITRDLNARRCWICRGKGKPKLQECSKCHKVRYCGPVCQKKDWPVHRTQCTKST